MFDQFTPPKPGNPWRLAGASCALLCTCAAILFSGTSAAKWWWGGALAGYLLNYGALLVARHRSNRI